MNRNAARILLTVLSLAVVGCGGGGNQPPAAPPVAPVSPTLSTGPTAPTSSAATVAADLEKEATKAGYEAGLKHGGDLFKAEQEGEKAPEAPENPYEGDCGSAAATPKATDEAEVDEEEDGEEDEESTESTSATTSTTGEPEDEEEDEEEETELVPPDTADLDTETCAKLAKIWKAAFDEAVPKGKKIAEENLGEDEDGDSESDGAPDEDTGVESAGELPEGYELVKKITSVSHLKEKSGTSTVLKVTVKGEVPTGGFSDPKLSLAAEPKLDEDGTLRLQFSVKSPAKDATVTQAFETKTAEFTFTGEVDKVKKIEVKGASNTSTSTVASD